MIGFKEKMQKKASEEYIRGKTTMSEAAKKAGITIWEMEKYLTGQGFKSSYSSEDLEIEVGTK